MTRDLLRGASRSLTDNSARLNEAAKNGFKAQAQQDALETRDRRTIREYEHTWHGLAAATREALQTAAEIEARTPVDILAKARLLAAVVYREGRNDFRFALALSLLRDMGETLFADRRAARD